MAATRAQSSPSVAGAASRSSGREAAPEHSGTVASRVVTDVVTGLLVGVISLTLSTALGALLFGAELGQFLDKAIGLAVLTSLTIAVLGLTLGSLPGTLMHMQDAPTAVLAGATAAIVAAHGVGVTTLATFMTVVATAALAGLATGALFLAFGLFRLGSLVRFLPYPVVGGFMAGTGWLLLTGGIGVMSGVSVSRSYLTDLFAPGLATQWLPGLAFAVTILVATRLSSHFLVWPALLVGSVVVFYALMVLTGGTVASWQAAGYLLGPFPDSSLLGVVRPADLALVDWPLVMAQLPIIATVALLSLIAVLLNATALELVTERRVDLNRELRAAGIGNLLAGALGGAVGYHSASLTSLNHRTGSGGRLPILIACLVLLGALLFGAGLFGAMPTAVVGGTIAFLGLAFLYQWLVESLASLSALEYVIVAVILVVIAVAGFLPGVGLGLVLTVVLFVISYSRVDAVRHSLTGNDMHSRVSRTPQERASLTGTGDAVMVLQLHGFLFFGTANAVLERIDRRTSAGPVGGPGAGAAPARPLDCVILDFKRVTGVDASGLLVLRTLGRSARANGYRLVLTDLGPGVARQLTRSGSHHDGAVGFEIVSSLDEALELSEERRLASAQVAQDSAAKAEPLSSLLEGSGVATETLLPFLELLHVASGEALVRQGDAPHSLYIVASGRLTTCMAAHGSQTIRLERIGPGSLVGELGFYAGTLRTASVVADESSSAYCLTTESMARFEDAEPHQAARLHALLARLMAERMMHLMRVVEALQR